MYEERSGWVTFAGVLLVIAGALNVIYGIAAIGNSNFFVRNTQYIFSDLKTWGWIVLILGIFQGLAGLSLFSGSEWARWFGIASASVNAIGQLAFVPAYPVWGLAMFAVDILIIYALAVHAGARLRTA